MKYHCHNQQKERVTKAQITLTVTGMYLCCTPPAHNSIHLSMLLTAVPIGTSMVAM